MKYLDEIQLKDTDSKTYFYKDLCKVELFLNEAFESHTTILKDNITK